jgi:hypothetical protein
MSLAVSRLVTVTGSSVGAVPTALVTDFDDGGPATPTEGPEDELGPVAWD